MVFDRKSFLECSEGLINSDSNYLLPVPEAILLFPCLCIQGTSAGEHSPLATFCPDVPVRVFLGMAVKRSLIGSWACNDTLPNWVLCHACRLWEAGKATLLLGSSGQPLIVPIPGRRIPALEQSVAVLEMGLGSAQAQAPLVACPELRRRLLLLQASMKVKITPKFTFILTLNSFRARIALKLL